MRHGMRLVICLGAMIVLAAVSGSASAQVPQTPTVLYNFDGMTHGANPCGDLTLSGSTMYGMTKDGGANGDGTIFSVSTSGGTPKVLFSFDGTNHGANPSGSLTLSGTTLYGMTYNGGASNDGTIISVATSGGTPKVLYSFDWTHGSGPMGSLTISGTSLYGMTCYGGNQGLGTIFSIPTIGGTPAVLFSFDGTNHGKTPFGSLLLSGSTLYGMSSGGGAYNNGTIFSFTTSGGTPKVLFSFDGTNHGANPWGSLTLSGKTLYGMTYNGGASNYGTIISVATSGGTPTVLYNFDGTTHGANPCGDLTLSGSTLYGMTNGGGSNDKGVIFSIPTSGGFPTVLFNFDGTSHGSYPYGSLTLSADKSTLFGMTCQGGTNDYGTIFSLPIKYSLTVNQNSSGLVLVTPSQATYSPTSTGVKIFANPNPGYYFVSWSVTGGAVDNATSATSTLTITGNCVLTVSFATNPYSLMLVSSNGTVGVSSSQTLYSPSSVVTIYAYPNPGYNFVSWSVTGGSVASGSSATTTLTITGNCTLTASFAEMAYGVAVVSANGNVTLTPPQGNSATYHYGDTIALAAAANSGWTFSTWTVTDASGNDLTASCIDNPISPTANLTMPAANVTLTATYALGYTGWQQSPGGTVSVSDSGPYTTGQVITATASELPGCMFVGWNVSGASTLSDPTELTTNLTVNGNFVLTAVFTYDQSCVMDGSFFSGYITSSLALTTLFAFDGPHGANPYGALTLGGSTLYGMAQAGGAYGNGTIFSIPASGGIPNILFSFDGAHGAEYYSPYLDFFGNSLTLGGSTLYGMTPLGGVNGYGTVFSIPTIGGTPTILCSFTGTGGQCPGVEPFGDLTLSTDGSTLYGMTSGRLLPYLSCKGSGTIFSIPTCGGSPTILFNFDGTHGAWPFGDLTLSANGSTLYGMTSGGGVSGSGTVFSIPSCGGTPTILYSFDGPHGGHPYGSLVLSGSTLYGMTCYGGSYYSQPYTSGYGTIFSLPTTGGTPTVLYCFNGYVGKWPIGSLSLNGSTLYGMAAGGGMNNGGAIFSIPTTGGSPRPLFDFNYNNNNSGYPLGSLTISGATLYGMTSQGASNGLGQIFSLPILPGVLLATVATSPNSPSWVYQNTPGTTLDRNVIPLTVSLLDTVINNTYTITVTQSGPGQVTPTGTWRSGSLVIPAVSASWQNQWLLYYSYYVSPFCYLVGGRVQGGGVVGSAENLATTGSCTVHIVVTGDVGGTASADVTVYVRPLGDIDNSGTVDGNVPAILNNSLNGFDTAPQTDDDCDLTGDGELTTADRVLLRMIINGLALP